MATSDGPQKPWYLRSSVPVLFPTHDGFDLSLPWSTFDALVQDIVRSESTAHQDDMEGTKDEKNDKDDNLTSLGTATSQEMQSALAQFDLTTTTETLLGAVVEPGKPEEDQSQSQSQSQSTDPFIQGLLSHNPLEPMPQVDMQDKMFTENADVAYRSTQSPLVDLFAELEDVTSHGRLVKLLGAAWEEDPSPHLRLFSTPVLSTLARPLVTASIVVRKKVGKEEKTGDADFEMVIVNAKPEEGVDDTARFDVKHGVSHGYWKDLLNILVLSVQGCLDTRPNPESKLYVKRSITRTTVTKEEAKVERHAKREQRHNRAMETFNSNRVYRGLYLTVARLFAEQLKTDLALLKSDDPKAKKNISLCAKWAPSHDRFHDKHTFIVSSIAEMLYPMAEIAAGDDHMDRAAYLRHARESYRRGISTLRAHLDVVERKLSARAYDKIEYNRVPSLAMNNYATIFADKDTERFEEYLDSVAEGKTHISGATLLPSTLVKKLRGHAASEVIERANVKVIDGQWKTLVQRIKDSGTLESSIAICDVSGSMTGHQFKDGTCPMDSAIGLSLLLAEVTAPPFGGHFITFSSNPEVQSIDLSLPLSSKVAQLRMAYWEMNTNFVAVFERLILPMAIRNKLSQEDMVKRVFVFSDMQFDQAQLSSDRFSTSFERIKRSYGDAGYEMPELIFWNLAGGRAGYCASPYGDTPAPKPVTSEEAGTAIISGYSQAMLKMFLDNGSFDDEDEDEEEKFKTTEEGDAVIVDSEAPVKKRRLDPMSTLKKAISHKAYDPLVVVD
ncbi:hypothetical protein O1611_g3821 [Lasiodiplodia mahajangana]|uniref:Uncharacterized protein n=1 Tax=Lasiodiplodia mahajangana TaxID=1108764 RepID=A0ACC2JRC5_9PEZI|nr:hypothetical protein O1611_g3821 [Lasiodiplodia mahajangana]